MEEISTGGRCASERKSRQDKPIGDSQQMQLAVAFSILPSNTTFIMAEAAFSEAFATTSREKGLADPHPSEGRAFHVMGRAHSLRGTALRTGIPESPSPAICCPAPWLSGVSSKSVARSVAKWRTDPLVAGAVSCIPCMAGLQAVRHDDLITSKRVQARRNSRYGKPPPPPYPRHAYA